VCTAVAVQRSRDKRIYKTVSGQWLGKHVPAAKDTSATIEELCFLCSPCQHITSKDKRIGFLKREAAKRGPESVELKNLRC
jgi:hypothetical protein